MGIRAKIGLLGALLLAGAAPGRAQQTCMLDGQSYPENAVVCSGGLVMYCSNGTWQGSDGQRCDVANGTYLGPRRPFHDKNAEPVPDFYKERYPDLHLE